MKIKKPSKSNVVIGCTFIVGVLAIISRFATTTNVAQTSTENPDNQLRTRSYAASSEEIARMLQCIVPSLRTYGGNWRIVSTSTREDVTTIVCEVPVLFFIDDLIVSVAENNQVSRVDIRSSSRVGKGDFGENQRHILQILSYLDKSFDSQDSPA